MQPCGFRSTEFHAATGALGLNLGRDAEGVVAWGGEPVYRLDGIEAVEALFAGRRVCTPATPWGTLRNWAEPADGRVETYLLRDCTQILLLTPTRAMILDRPFHDTPPVEDWLFHHFQLE